MPSGAAVSIAAVALACCSPYQAASVRSMPLLVTRSFISKPQPVSSWRVAHHQRRTSHAARWPQPHSGVLSAGGTSVS